MYTIASSYRRFSQSPYLVAPLCTILSTEKTYGKSNSETKNQNAQKVRQYHHLSLNREGRNHKWFHNQYPPFFSVLNCPLGLGELQACPFPDVFRALLLSAVSSSPFLCALQDGFGQTWSTGDMTILLQFASLYNGQKVFVWPDCLLDLGTDFLVGNMVFEWDA